jgi:hypothetical protein
MYVPVVPAELIYDLDETGLSDWEDSRPTPALVPMRLDDSMVRSPVNRDRAFTACHEGNIARISERCSDPVDYEQSQSPGCQEKPAILFCHHCPCHCSEAILEELANYGILLITDSRQTSQIFKVPDVLLFGCFKSAKKYRPRDDNEDPQVDDAICVFDAYEIATMSSTVRDSWEKGGFGFVKRDATYSL